MAVKHARIPGTPCGTTLFVLPEIPDAATEQVKNGLAIRNAANVNGRCPCCGAIAEIRADPEHALVFHAVFEHEPWCDALTNEAA